MSEKILDQLLDGDATNSLDIIPCRDAIEIENTSLVENSIKQISNDIESDITEKKSAYSKLSDTIELPKLFIWTSLSLILVFYLPIQYVYSIIRYAVTGQVTYLLITLLCFICPSCMFGIYKTAKYSKENIETESESSHSSDVAGIRILLNNTIYFLPLKFRSLVKILKFLINHKKRSCNRFDEESREKIKELKSDERIFSFFQSFYASLPEIVLLFHNILLSSDKYFDYTIIIYFRQILSFYSIYSLCATVDREDDGTMSIILSRIGWLSTIFSRCLLLALLTSTVGYWTVLPCAAHIILITVYLTLSTEQTYLKYSNANCDKDTLKLKACRFFALLTTFGVQSLIFWPMMFDLNDKSRPAKFFGLLLAENMATIFAVFIWNFDFDLLESSQLLRIPSLLSMVLIMSFTLLGMLFVYLYNKWKPRRTAYWKLHRDHMEGKKNTEPATYGVYYEFCSVAFTIPAHLSPNELEDLKINP